MHESRSPQSAQERLPALVAKFGVVGLVTAAFPVIGFVGTLRAFRARMRGLTVAQRALLGVGAVVVVGMLLQSPYEALGSAIGLLLFAALTARDRDAATRAGRPTI
jgi:FtsH-binding integral membrane protein